MHSSAKELGDSHVVKSSRGESQSSAAAVRLGIERHSQETGRYERASNLRGAAVARRLREVAAHAETDLRLILIGAWAVVLSRYSAEQKVTFGRVATED